MTLSLSTAWSLSNMIDPPALAGLSIVHPNHIFNSLLTFGLKRPKCKDILPCSGGINFQKIQHGQPNGATALFSMEA
jgi:hypothetical protein